MQSMYPRRKLKSRVAFVNKFRGIKTKVVEQVQETQPVSGVFFLCKSSMYLVMFLIYKGPKTI